MVNQKANRNICLFKSIEVSLSSVNRIGRLREVDTELLIAFRNSSTISAQESTELLVPVTKPDVPIKDPQDDIDKPQEPVVQFSLWRDALLPDAGIFIVSILTTIGYSLVSLALPNLIGKLIDLMSSSNSSAGKESR